MHPTHALKNLYLFSLAFLTGSLLHAQKASYCKPGELEYKNDTKLYHLKSTGKSYTGYEYYADYYRPSDTTQMRYFVNGKMDWSKTYASGMKPLYYSIYYNHGLKNDSICYENYGFDQYSGDTTLYEIQYIDKKKVKWYRQYNYHLSQNVFPNRQCVLSAQRTFRFFTRAETKSFTAGNFKEAGNFDSLGYHNTYDESGYYAQYYPNGKVQVEGMNCRYELRLTNNGEVPYYYSYQARRGSWKYYTAEGVIAREEMYDQNGILAATNAFYPDGQLAAKYNYTKKGLEIRLPPTHGISVESNENCKVTETRWYNNGVLQSETFTKENGSVITYSYHVTGKPQMVQAYTSARRPFGIYKTWDEKGNVTEYINYSVEWIDTLCYTAQNGNIRAMSLRNRQVPMHWDAMPVDYYGNETKKYLYAQCTVYRQFYLNDQVKAEVNLKNGKREGLYTEWDSSGVEIARRNYTDDVPNGEWIEWHANGRIKKAFHYANGIREGTCTEYYSTGSVKWENVYVHGVPGKSKAYAENGSLLESSTYLSAFYPASCIEERAKVTRPTALHYYFMDTSLNRSSVIIPDTAVQHYVYKVMAVSNFIDPGYDLCGPMTVVNDEAEFDLYHSCFVISKSLYTDSNKVVINEFFKRNGIHMDRSVQSDEPVLGFEKEFRVYYSSKQMLNKQVIVDSLEYYLAPFSNDAKQGYIMSVDNNFPRGSALGGRETSITSVKGYSTILVVSGSKNVYPVYNTFKATRYIVYDDLTCDFQSETYDAVQMTYWGGRK